MTSEIDPVAWSRRHFSTMADGGTWAVPRSGLIFVRHGDRLELIDRMPHDPAMQLPPWQLREQQQADFEVIKRHFEAAGIPVIDASEK